MMLVVTACVLEIPTSNAPPCVKYPLNDEIELMRKANTNDFIKAKVMKYSLKA
jgi:hypothetical protein